MTTHSRPRHVTPHKTVSEATREREALRHWLPFQIPGNVQESRKSTPETGRLSSANVILTALTQLGIHQVGAERAFVSLFDSEFRYFISEATSGTYLRPSTPNHEHNQPFRLCGTALRRADDACNYTLLNHLTDDPKDGDTNVLPVTVVPDWSSDDDRFQSHTLPLLDTLHASFYAAVPIRTKRGINIGVYTVVNSSKREWTQANADRMRDISCTIADHLETESVKIVNRRNARMSRGLGSFLEGGSTLTGWHLGANTTDFLDHVMSPEGSLNSTQQSLQQEVDYATDTSQISNDDSPKQRRRVNARGSRTMESMSENQSLGNVFSRAANIIRESVEVEGCIFLDATMASYRANRAKSPSSVKSLNQSSATSSDDTQEDAICDIKGFSTSGNSSIDRAGGPQVSVVLGERFMMKMLKQYPQGKVFNFSDDGELQTSDSSSEDIFLPPRSEQPGRQAGQETPPSPVPLNKAPKRLVSRQREGKIISAAFPKARSVAFFPVWDPRQERWRASGLIYTNAPFRSFTVQGELSFLRAFGMLTVTEIMRLEASQDSKIKSDALGSLSHELRSPLHGVLLGTELMADTKLNVFQTNIAHTIETCSRTLLDTIDHLLDYSRVNSFANGGKTSTASSAFHPEPPAVQSYGKKHLVTEYFVDHLVEDVVESVFAGFNFQYQSIHQYNARQKQQKPRPRRNSDYADNVANSAADYHDAMDQLTPGISGNPGSIFTFGNVNVTLSLDPQFDWLFRFHVGAVRRIVMNIVGNALKYTSDGSINIKLTHKLASVRRRRAEQVVCFTVTDTGKGISEDFLHRTIFKPFSQEDDLSPGTGIGLSLVKRIVNQFRGQISIDSQVGVGTTVTVLLPLERPNNIQDLAGLRIRLMFGSTAIRVSAEFRNNLEHICKDWLKLELLAQDDESKKPDIILWTQDALPPTSEFTSSLALIPNVVICPNALAAHDKGRESYETGWTGVFEFVSQPVGPRKLAKTISLAYNRWVDDPSPVHTPRPRIFGRHSSNSIPPHTSPSHTNDSTTEPAPVSPSVEGSGAGESPVPPPITTQNLSTTDNEVPKILLVEDNHINLKILAAYMKKLKTKYDTAVNGREAVKKYTQSPKDFMCILLDISMPVMNGFEAARHIRAFETQEKIENGVPLFAISGLASEEAQREAYGSGINMFLLKPVKLEVLGGILRDRGILEPANS
ncbi:hypothetical protein FPOA_06509 [Fusarium poae]|uniref:histidine kinase n=1 Tax=Fusarium poae TaxID=36050 RepID=A0A1B8AZR9_FUSPO|nr:hypothetical protein FPOA_06509 [Fusarium poae]